MQTSPHIHAVALPFRIPVAGGGYLERLAHAFFITGETITLIDSGTAGSEHRLFSAIAAAGRQPAEITDLLLSHSHPDHIGAALPIRALTGCRILAHPAEKRWIEDVEQQERERPVPGFRQLVAGPVPVDRLLTDGLRLQPAPGLCCKVLHTPGHSAGSVSLFFKEERTLFTGDALPLPGDLPIYEDIAGSVASIRRLAELLPEVEILLSSWEPPVCGQAAVRSRLEAALAFLRQIHETVLQRAAAGTADGMEICRQVVAALDLPLFAANPLVARGLVSSLRAPDDLFR